MCFGFAGRKQVKNLLTQYAIVLEVSVDEFQFAMEQGMVRPCTADGFVVRKLDLTVEKHFKLTRMHAHISVESGDMPVDVPVDKPAFVFYKIADDVAEQKVVKKLLANSMSKPRQKRPSSVVGRGGTGYMYFSNPTKAALMCWLANGGASVDVRLSYYGLGGIPAGLLHYDVTMSPVCVLSLHFSDVAVALFLIVHLQSTS